MRCPFSDLFRLFLQPSGDLAVILSWDCFTYRLILPAPELTPPKARSRSDDIRDMRQCCPLRSPRLLRNAASQALRVTMTAAASVARLLVTSCFCEFVLGHLPQGHGYHQADTPQSGSIPEGKDHLTATRADDCDSTPAEAGPKPSEQAQDPDGMNWYYWTTEAPPIIAIMAGACFRVLTRSQNGCHAERCFLSRGFHAH